MIRGVTAAAVACLLAAWGAGLACGEEPAGVKLDPALRIGKVMDYVNDSEVSDTGRERSLGFDRRYHMYGAVTAEQRHRKTGHYFYVPWSSKGDSGPVTVRFEYRQQRSQNKVYRMELPFENARGPAKANFEIVGDAYAAQGVVTSWRVALVRDGVVVAEKRSFLW